MKAKTENFGEISYNQEDVIEFKEGLPGFTKYKNYIIIEKEEFAPFKWLQSIEKNSVAFVIIEPNKFRPSYRAVSSIEELNIIDIKNDDEAIVYAMVTMSEKPQDVSMNLKAPIIINKIKKTAIQVILRESDYDIEYKMFSPSKMTEIRYSNYESSITKNTNIKQIEISC